VLQDLEPPGHGVDRTVTADLRTMIMVWMGDIPMHRARKSGAVSPDGPRTLVRAFPAWLRLSVLAGVERPSGPSAF
jgi:hypothetical protein